MIKIKAIKIIIPKNQIKRLPKLGFFAESGGKIPELAFAVFFEPSAPGLWGGLGRVIF